jgi:hypothetical protein
MAVAWHPSRSDAPIDPGAEHRLRRPVRCLGAAADRGRLRRAHGLAFGAAPGNSVIADRHGFAGSERAPADAGSDACPRLGRPASDRDGRRGRGPPRDPAQQLR